MRKRISFPILLVLIICGISFTQQSGNSDRSPKAQAQCKFSDDGTITVDYFSPSTAGRRIFGGLVPYGKVWRTDDKATTFATDEDLVAVKGQKFPLAVTRL